MEALDVKNHWLGQSQDHREYTGPLLNVENVNLRFTTKDSFFESRHEYVQASNNVSLKCMKVKPLVSWVSLVLVTDDCTCYCRFIRT